MSTEYKSLKEIPFSELFDGRLERFGVREHIKDGKTDDRRRCLTDGRNFLWVYRCQEGAVAAFTRFGANAPGKILGAVAETFDADIVPSTTSSRHVAHPFAVRYRGLSPLRQESRGRHHSGPLRRTPNGQGGEDPVPRTHR